MGMLELQTAITEFYRQACPNVFLAVTNPLGLPYPRIIFEYTSGDFDTESMWTYQIWTEETDFLQVLNIADGIAKLIPIGGEILEIPKGTVFEYKDRQTGQWIVFDMNDFDSLFDPRTPGGSIATEWRKVAGEKVGTHILRRGSPFNTPRPTDNVRFKAMYGTINVRNFNID